MVDYLNSTTLFATVFVPDGAARQLPPQMPAVCGSGTVAGAARPASLAHPSNPIMHFFSRFPHTDDAFDDLLLDLNYGFAELVNNADACYDVRPPPTPHPPTTTTTHTHAGRRCRCRLWLPPCSS